MTEPRVLLITGEYPPMPGGIADYSNLLRSALKCQGVQTIVMSALESNSDESVASWNWRAISAVSDAMKRHSIDVVHIQYQAGAFGMHPAVNVLPRRLNGVPVVTTFHDLRPPYLFPRAGKLRYFLMRRMARWSSAVIVTNPDDRDILIDSRIKPEMIPLGPSLPVPGDHVKQRASIGYFGFPSRQKGFDLLITAIGHFPRATRPRLLVVGGNPPDVKHHGFMTQAEVTELAAKSGVTVTWTGHLGGQAASDALACCSVLAFPFPSGATQRSSALIAALQTGRPVVTTAAKIPGDMGNLAQLQQLIQVESADAARLQDALAVTMTRTIQADPLPGEYQWTSIAARHVKLYRSITREAGG